MCVCESGVFLVDVDVFMGSLTLCIIQDQLCVWGFVFLVCVCACVCMWM